MVIHSEHYCSAVLTELIVIPKHVFNSQFTEFRDLFICNFPASNDILRFDELLATFILNGYGFYDIFICSEHLNILIVRLRFLFLAFNLCVQSFKAPSPSRVRACLLTSSSLTQARDSFASSKIFSFPHVRLKLFYRFVNHSVPRIFLKLIRFKNFRSSVIIPSYQIRINVLKCIEVLLESVLQHCRLENGIRMNFRTSDRVKQIRVFWIQKHLRNSNWREIKSLSKRIYVGLLVVYFLLTFWFH